MFIWRDDKPSLAGVLSLDDGTVEQYAATACKLE